MSVGDRGGGSAVARAQVLLELGRPAEALRLVASSPGADLNVGAVRVVALLQLQRPDDARTEAEALVGAYPDEVEPLRLLAHAELARLRPRQATAFAFRALAMSPDDFDVLRTASICSRKAGRAHDAVMAAHRMVQLAPDDPTALATYAEALVAQQQFQLAERVARDAVALSANNPSSLTALGDALDRQGRRPEAAALLAEAGRVDPTDDTVPTKIVTLLGKPSALAFSVIGTLFALAQVIRASRLLGPEGAAGAVLAFVVSSIAWYAIKVRNDLRGLPPHLRRGLRRERLGVVAILIAGGSVLAAVFALPICAALLSRGETRGPVLPVWVTLTLVCGWILAGFTMLQKTQPHFLKAIARLLAGHWADRRVQLPISYYPTSWGAGPGSAAPAGPADAAGRGRG